MTPEEWSVGTASMQRYSELYDNAYARLSTCPFYRFPREAADERAREWLAGETEQGSGLSLALMQQAEETLQSARDTNAVFDNFTRIGVEYYSPSVLGGIQQKMTLILRQAGILPQAIAAKLRAEDILANSFTAQQNSYKEVESDQSC